MNAPAPPRAAAGLAPLRCTSASSRLPAPPPRALPDLAEALSATASTSAPAHAAASSFSHLAVLAYERVVMPCHNMGCGDITYRRCVKMENGEWRERGRRGRALNEKNLRSCFFFRPPAPLLSCPCRRRPTDPTTPRPDTHPLSLHSTARSTPPSAASSARSRPRPSPSARPYLPT